MILVQTNLGRIVIWFEVGNALGRQSFEKFCASRRQAESRSPHSLDFTSAAGGISTPAGETNSALATIWRARRIPSINSEYLRCFVAAIVRLNDRRLQRIFRRQLNSASASWF